MKLCKNCLVAIGQSVANSTGTMPELITDEHETCTNCDFSQNDFIVAETERLTAFDTEEDFDTFVYEELEKSKKIYQDWE
jgi:hypothetical protein